MASEAGNVFQLTTSTNTACGGDFPPQCLTCGTCHWGLCNHMSWTPNYFYPVYPTYQKDEVAELKAWLDGFWENRKMTEKNLKRVRDKLEEFCG